MKILEREAALAILEAAHRRAVEGRGCVALVGGEAGIGKTALVTRFVESLEQGTATWGRCDSLITPRVLGPAYDIAAALGGGLVERLEAARTRTVMFGAFLEEVRRGTGHVYVVEDLHWADEATLDLVKYLARRIGDTNALLILTFRDDELGERHPLRLVLGEVPREQVARVTLEPLSLDAVRELAAGRDAERLLALTNGNPFFLTEVLAEAADAMPASVRDAVRARAMRLSRAATEALELASVEPGGLEPWVLEACLPGSSPAVAECEAHGILCAREGRLHFRHELARLAIVEGLGAARAIALHRSVLAALESRAGFQASPARLTHHAEGADDSAAVLRHALAGAQRSARLGAHREALELYEAALRRAEALEPEVRAGLLEDLAVECLITARMERGIAAREEAVAIWRRLGNPEREAMAVAGSVALLVGAGRNALAEDAVRAAREALRGRPPSRAHAFVHRINASLRMLERDVAEAISEGSRAIALAGAAGDIESIVHAGNTIGTAMILAGDKEGVAAIERSRLLAEENGLDLHVANAYGNTGSALGEVGRYPEARETLRRGIEFAVAHDLDNSRFYQQAWLALAELHLGNWAEAGALAQEVLASRSSQAIARMVAGIALGRLRARRGDPGAWSTLDDALALAQGTGTLQRLAPARAARAEAAWLEGEPGAAAREAAAAYELALAKGHAGFVGELAYWQWKGGRVFDLPVIAARPFALQVTGSWREASDAWTALGCPYEAARALAEGDVAAQLEALAVFEELGARPAAGRVRQALRSAGVRRIPRGPRAATRANPRGLTPRELEILAGLADNLTNAEIAARLHISAKTVDHHVGAVLAKLGADSRRGAVRAAAELGVLAK